MGSNTEAASLVYHLRFTIRSRHAPPSAGILQKKLFQRSNKRIKDRCHAKLTYLLYNNPGMSHLDIRVRCNDFSNHRQKIQSPTSARGRGGEGGPSLSHRFWLNRIPWSRMNERTTHVRMQLLSRAIDSPLCRSLSRFI